MLPKVTTLNELENQVRAHLIILDVIKQINKDFELVGIDYKFKVKEHFYDFSAAFQQIIEHIINTNFDVFLNLLYRIDLDETKIRNIIQVEEENIYAKISFEILKREWQKVWFRKNYS